VNPDPDPVRNQGFDDQKLKKNTAADFFFWSKTAIYSCPSYRRSLQPLKQNIQHFKK
jgi:hypothetical protein